MAGLKSPDDLLRDAWEHAKRIGGIADAARDMGLPRGTFDSRVKQAMKRFDLPHPCSKIVTGSAFTAYQSLSKTRSLEELMDHRRSESQRARDYEATTAIMRIDIKTPGPIGIMVFGDPHIDNPGCDFELLERHLKLVGERNTYIFAGNIGDLQDNWIGRLERLYAETTVNAKEIWKLVEWMVAGAGVQWTWLIRGNHDAWSGKNDPLDWITKGAGVGIDRDSGARFSFRHPNGVETRMHARHDFPGNSMFNPLHALKRETLHGHRDHVIVAGHRHIGADAGDVNGDGRAFQMVRVSGYKVSDSFRHTMGLKARPIHPAALIVIDPDADEMSRDRAWCAPTVEKGVEYLDWLRGKWEADQKRSASHGRSNRPDGAQNRKRS